MNLQYAPYGKAGPLISRLGFGAMRLPTRGKKNYAGVNFSASARLMRAAMANGVNFFDSHHGYHGGNSEVAIGKALKGWRGQRIHIQTKTPWYTEKPVEYFERLLDEALEKLGVNSIDYLLHHSMQMKTWQKRGKKFLRFTDKAIKQGLIRHRGFSSHDTPENIRQFIDTGEFSVMLVSYNWMNPEMRDTIAYAAQRGMGVSIMNPVGGGLLTAWSPRIKGLLPGAKTPAELALRYVLTTPGVTAAFSGMNAAEQIVENVGVASRKTPMTDKQQRHMVERMGRIEREADKLCTGCGYCMPCPHGVDIPGNFNLLNRARLFGQTRWSKLYYGAMKGGEGGDNSAVACKQCGLCEPKCPIHVPIRRQLQEVVDVLG